MQNIPAIEALTLSTKQRVLIRLGGQCARCKTTDQRVLCVHHKNGDGHLERKSLMHYGFDRRQAQWDCHNCHDLIHNHSCRVPKRDT